MSNTLNGNMPDIIEPEKVVLGDWEEFRTTGLLWFVNTILHVFGWAIVVSYDEKGNMLGGYPVRTKCRGFDQNTNDKSYLKLAKYMAENAERLNQEANEKN